MAAEGIPTFHAQSRQVITVAEVWNYIDRVPEAASAKTSDCCAVARKGSDRISPATGLTAKDFRVFDDGVEQTINYFQETDFHFATGEWMFGATTNGLWGVPYPFSSASASYLIGYVPTAPLSGECRTIKIVVQDRYVLQHREKYCPKRVSATPVTRQEAKLESRMRRFVNFTAPGDMEVSLGAFTFWSSGVLSLTRPTGVTDSATSLPGKDFTYVVEVHDSQAPATVQIATKFRSPLQLWMSPCREDAAIHVLGIVYKTDGQPAGEFGDVLRCKYLTANYAEPVRKFIDAYKIPALFDAQIELRPGEYRVCVVVTDGKNFGRAEVPLRIEPLNNEKLTLSDVVLTGIVRDASWIVRNAEFVAPYPIVPNPLVSESTVHAPLPGAPSLAEKIQFIQVPKAEIPKDKPLSIYFEIYRPLPETADSTISYRMRITDANTGALVMNTGPMSAAEWVVPGKVVVPVGLTLKTDKLSKGSYKLEVQASDAVGRESEWRGAIFAIP